MKESPIVCPSCGNAFSLTEASASMKALAARIRAEAAQHTSLEIADLKAQLDERAKAMKANQASELELRKRVRAVEEREQALALEVERTIDAERKKIEAAASERVAEETRLKMAEKDQKMEEMRRQLDDLRRRADQGSQQLQGEVLELELETKLLAMFPSDSIEAVAKGARGADVHQIVKNASGKAAGRIVWEAKRTKQWRSDWIDKIKSDQRAEGAEIAVLVTQAMPAGVSGAELIDGVWVVDYETYGVIALALRESLIRLAQARAAAAGKGDMKDLLYDYLTGTEFCQRVATVVEAFVAMRADLESERRSVERCWAKRESQINKAISAMAGMYGDLQGTVGPTLPTITHLELEAQVD